jgi:hypothetical protein
MFNLIGAGQRHHHWAAGESLRFFIFQRELELGNLNHKKEQPMQKPIYKLCLIHGFTEAYYQLSDEQKKALWDDLDRVLEPTGAKLCGPYYDCQWSNDKYITWFIMEYPGIESAIMDTHGCQSIQLFRYMISETILGIEEENINRITTMSGD